MANNMEINLMANNMEINLMANNMEISLCVTDMTQWFFLDPDEASKIEAKFKQTEHFQEWSYIGDHLLKYALKKTVDTVLVVTKEQYTVLVSLIPKEKASTPPIDT
jgi:predicted oxidoreductase